MLKKIIFASAILFNLACFGENQTQDLSPLHSEKDLPYSISIDLDFEMANGFHSGSVAVFKGKWLFIGGRTNGMHGFSSTMQNFPTVSQNRSVFVVDPVTQITYTKSLDDPSSGLTPTQIETLAVTSPQYDQYQNTLYITGGYGFDTYAGTYTTKSLLTAINVPGLMHWVINASPGETAAQYIRQIANPVVQVTGGDMFRSRGDLHLLIFGQNFTGSYFEGGATGVYTEQVRRFKIKDDGVNLSIKVEDPFPLVPDPNFRRRDLNIIPIIQKAGGMRIYGYTALSGVFLPGDNGGAWTVPVIIDIDGIAKMPDPAKPKTFKQGVDNYVSAIAGLFSNKRNEMYILSFGGISYLGDFFIPDPDLPFTNHTTTIKIDKKGHFTQYLMDNTFPIIPPPVGVTGDYLRFGAAAVFFPNPDIELYKNTTIKFDKLGKEPVVIGHIAGGIQSAVANTTTPQPPGQTLASTYVFTVTLYPKD